MQNALEIVENRKYPSSCSLCQLDLSVASFFLLSFSLLFGETIK